MSTEYFSEEPDIKYTRIPNYGWVVHCKAIGLSHVITDPMNKGQFDISTTENANAQQFFAEQSGISIPISARLIKNETPSVPKPMNEARQRELLSKLKA